ncbi:MAG: hypothetical protein COB30_016220 [Ectothiorhodospiraceae bacterium]|nr:hypothetical protein [Ectothiorhodospiraceae bacterium]
MSDEKSAKHSNICHIEAANEGGERWNADMGNKQRADYNNLILFCPPHHDETDDVVKYTIGILKAMKKNHEHEMAGRCSIKNPLAKRPSLLTEVINKIAEVDLDELTDEVIINSFSVEDKISYNHVTESSPIIQEYSGYQGKINAIYSEFEREGNGRKTSLLRNVKSIYLEAKGKVLGTDQSLGNVRVHADQLIEYVKRRLHELVGSSLNNDSSLPYEDVEFAVSIVMVDGFMRCKILEEPKSDC